MKAIAVDMVYILRGKEVDPDLVTDAADIAFKTEDGVVIKEFDGCDWKENPADLIVKLAKKVRKGDEIVELADGSDTLWYGILRAKKSKKKAAKKAARNPRKKA